MDTTPRTPISAALLVGSLAAVVAALVSLPLRSPHDGLLNSASVVAGVLALSVVGGLVWRGLSRRTNGARWFTLAMNLGFLIWVAIAFSLETQLERMVSFSVPLAAIAFGAIALLVPRLFVNVLAQRRIVVLAALAVAIVAGAGLANRGDAESGRLELPPRADADHVRTF